MHSPILQLLLGVAAVAAMVAALVLTRRALKEGDERLYAAHRSLTTAERRIADLATKEQELLLARRSLQAAEQRREELASVEREARQLRAALERSREEAAEFQAALEESRVEESRLSDLLNGVVARYRPVINVERRAHELQTEYDAQKAALEGELSDVRARAAAEALELRTVTDEVAKLRQEAEMLRAQYDIAQKRYEALTADVHGLEERPVDSGTEFRQRERKESRRDRVARRDEERAQHERVKERDAAVAPATAPNGGLPRDPFERGMA